MAAPTATPAANPITAAGKGQLAPDAEAEAEVDRQCQASGRPGIMMSHRNARTQYTWSRLPPNREDTDEVRQPSYLHPTSVLE